MVEVQLNANARRGCSVRSTTPQSADQDALVLRLGSFARALAQIETRRNLCPSNDELMGLLVAELLELMGGVPPTLLSLDVFDTLLLRNDKCEARRYWEISESIAQRLKEQAVAEVHPADLFVARMLALRAGYACGPQLRGCREGEISGVLATELDLLGLEPRLLSCLLEIELAYESANLFGNRFLLAALERAFGRVPMIGISDMYLRAEDIGVLVARVLGSDCHLAALFSSADHILNKRSGHAYPFVASAMKLDVTQLLHIGDDVMSDLHQAQRSGCQALLFPVTDREQAQRHDDLERFLEERRREGLEFASYARH